MIVASDGVQAVCQHFPSPVLLRPPGGRLLQTGRYDLANTHLSMVGHQSKGLLPRILHQADDQSDSAPSTAANMSPSQYVSTKYTERLAEAGSSRRSAASPKAMTILS